MTTTEPSEVTRLRALAMAGAGALRTGDQWMSWLHRADRFGELGFINTMLVWAQCPDAVAVHDYAEWRRRGRRVRRGERGIRIIRRGTVASVFDMLQTEGETTAVMMPRLPRWGGTVRPESWHALLAVAFPAFGDMDASDVGQCVNRYIATHGNGGEMAAALELARRAGHVLLHQHDHLTGAVESESVAFLLALRLGLDISGFAFPHVSSWAGADPRAPAAATVAAVGERVLTAFGQAEASLPDTERLVKGPRSAAPVRLAGQDREPQSDPAVGRVLEAAREFYGGQLIGSWVPGYLGGRGFGETVRQRWSIGYAPATWTALTDHLRSLGHGDAAIEASGLAKHSARGTLIDVFRDRAMFPVRAADGTVLGFVGRAHPDAGKDVPKYLNTRETAHYRKGHVLFGLHEAQQAFAAGARPVITEGPLDAIAVTVAGGDKFAAVAPCGTALTAEQVGLLGPYLGRRPIVAFDADQAGKQAAVRAWKLLRGCPLEPRVADFPEGQDPAGLLGQHGPDALVRTLESSVRPISDIVVDTAIGRFEHWLEFVEGKFNALHAVGPLIASLPPPAIARQVSRAADQLGLAHAEVTTAVTDALSAAVDEPADWTAALGSRVSSRPASTAGRGSGRRPGKAAGRRDRRVAG